MPVGYRTELDQGTTSSLGADHDRRLLGAARRSSSTRSEDYYSRGLTAARQRVRIWRVRCVKVVKRYDEAKAGERHRPRYRRSRSLWCGRTMGAGNRKQRCWRMIAGSKEHHRRRYHDRAVTSSTTSAEGPRHRMVFQNYALYPHSVAEKNVVRSAAETFRKPRSRKPGRRTPHGATLQKLSIASRSNCRAVQTPARCDGRANRPTIRRCLFDEPLFNLTPSCGADAV